MIQYLAQEYVHERVSEITKRPTCTFRAQGIPGAKLMARPELNLQQSKVQVFDTLQVVNCIKIESDAALLPSWFNW